MAPVVSPVFFNYQVFSCLRLISYLLLVASSDIWFTVSKRFAIRELNVESCSVSVLSDHSNELILESSFCFVRGRGLLVLLKEHFLTNV